LEEIVKKVPYPLFANMLVGGKTPILPASDLEKMGYKFAVSPIETLMVCGTALQSMMTTLKQSGTLEEHLNGKMSFGDVKDLLNLDHYLDVAAEGSMDL
jgi:2-methylisocitrate lyase-like PEP mutase family enzyme